jgi:adsorption protein A
MWHYSLLFGDSAYFLRGPTLKALYGEVRQGITFNVRDTLLITPHAILNGRGQFPNATYSSYVEGGAGLSLRYLFNDSTYQTQRASFEVLLHCKRGEFRNQITNPVPEVFQRCSATGILRF